jgi:hypothetical protein
MNERQLFDRLTRMFNKKELQVLSETVIYKDGEVYSLFDEYFITKEDGDYVLEKQGTSTVKHFFSLKNAVIWASLDKTNQIMDANRVAYLDTMLDGATANMEVHKALARTSKNLETKSTHIIKLQEDRMKKSQILEEIEVFARRVRRWQEKRFKQISK